MHATRLRSGGFDTGAAAVRLPAIGRSFQVVIRIAETHLMCDTP